MQYSSYFSLRHLSKFFETQLSGAFLLESFSNSKDQINFTFQTANKDIVQLQCKFAEGYLFCLLENEIQNSGHKSIFQFKSIENQLVQKIEIIPYDRVWFIQFSNNYRLYFKHFGSFGNILLFEMGSTYPVNHFRLHLKKDLHFIQPVSKDLNFYIESENYSFIDSEIHQIAQNELQLTQPEYIKKVIDIIDDFELEITETTGALPYLNVRHKQGEKDNAAVLQLFAKKYLHAFYFLQEKKNRIQQLSQRISHLQKLEKELHKKQQLISSRRSYKELGDIVLSYAHQIKTGVSNAFVPDFYTGEQIRIKLDPKLNAAENAEKFYKKAKNEHKEIEKVKEDLLRTETQLAQLKIDFETVNRATAFKELKSNKKEEKSEKSKTNLFKTLNYDGFEILIGKNAKNNDALLRAANKYDMWFHAQGVQGSHVWVKKRLSPLPSNVIEFAAKLAAQNSKAKTQKIVPVQFTEKRFISKSKNSEPGEVKLQKFDTVDAVLD